MQYNAVKNHNILTVRAPHDAVKVQSYLRRRSDRRVMQA